MRYEYAPLIAKGLDDADREPSGGPEADGYSASKNYTKDEADAIIKDRGYVEGMFWIRLSHELAVAWADRLRGHPEPKDSEPDIEALAEKVREIYEQRVVWRTEFPPWSEVADDWKETFRQMARVVIDAPKGRQQ